MRILFFLFVLIPLTEIILLINVGQMIGAWYTIGLVLFSAFVGVNMLRHQGLNTLTRARARMNNGELPASEMIEGLVLAVGGALLITPGFITDFMGFCCLIPFTRRAMARRFSHLLVPVSSQPGAMFFSHQRSNPHQHNSSPGSRTPDDETSGQIYDGEYHRDD